MPNGEILWQVLKYTFPLQNKSKSSKSGIYTDKVQVVFNRTVLQHTQKTHHNGMKLLKLLIFHCPLI